MTDFNQKKYYKLFTGTNQTDGYDKIHLGYESKTADIVFKKDASTSFHMPIFSTIQNISGEIIGSGAIAGPIPAMADRIYKKQGNYGNTTPWGSTTDIPNGSWLCSWLYSLTGETPRWFDRFYNPGKVDYSEALIGELSEIPFIKNDPIFVDIPSTLNLEPGVLYQYFHCGEKTAQKIVDTFSGSLSAHLRLNLQTWSTTPVDESIYENKVYLNNFKDAWALSLQEPDIVNRNVLSFKNNDLIDAFVIYDESYNQKNEFTLSFWAQNENWSEAPSTQLVGNLNYGGYGIFFNNLKYYPFFAVPETNYGHLFYFNQDGKNFLDKSTQPVIAELTAVDLSTPKQINVNGENEIIILDTNSGSPLYKLNHLGDVLAVPRLSTGEPFLISGEPKQFIIDGNNNCLLQTTEKSYLFDEDLVFLSLSAVSYVENISANFSVLGFEITYATNSQIQPGLYTASGTTITSNKNGSGAVFDIRVNSSSAIETIYLADGGSNYTSGEIITINNSIFTNVNGGYPSISVAISSVGFGGKTAFNTAGTLIYEPACKEVLFDSSNQKWIIGGDDMLYCNGVLLTGIESCTNINVDPENNIWAAHSLNKITKINPITLNILSTFEVGLADNNKNISFVYTYNRETDAKAWYSFIYINKEQRLYKLNLNGDIIQVTYLPDLTNMEQSPPDLQEKRSMTFDSKGDFTGYEWKRIFNKVLYNNNPQMQFKIAAKKPLRGTALKTFSVSVPVQYLSDNTWHSVIGTLKNHTLSLYIDTYLRDRKVLPGNYVVSYFRKNNLSIGTPTGKFANLNIETNSQSLIFNGYIDNIKIYDYAINPNFYNMFIRSVIVGQDLHWSLQTAAIQYIESIDRFFKHKAPGSKSPFFKIKISGYKTTDENLRNVIEMSIKEAILQTKPAYSELLDIEWV